MIQKLLIANRGEIARRIQRSCRALGIQTVAVYSEVDASAPFVLEADQAIALGGRTPADSYLRAEAIIDAALVSGADAIHPGYGFLAENAGFARACAAAGLMFVGPAPETIETMGSKIRARAVMEAAGVPLAPALTVNESSPSDHGTILQRLGLPVVIKASMGGGGKGMRIVRASENFGAALAAARSESLAAFGDDTVFVERYVEAARHIEVQIIGDCHGNVHHLFERECSIQRRHQKVVEECPASISTPRLRERLTTIAVSAARALNYLGVGTVEFLYAERTDEIFFLEINTRLQVEHPVTEAVTGVDLVKAQIQLAEGAAVADVIGEPEIDGHAVEARLYAEDAAAGFLPAVGTLHRLAVRSPGVRVDQGPSSGDEVTADYDPMIAKIVVHADTRAAAIRKLSNVLRTAEIHGLTTNRDFLVRVLEHPDFVSGRFDTGFLEQTDSGELFQPLVADPGERRIHAAAAALALQACERARAIHGRTLPSGWRNNRAALQSRALRDAAGAEVMVRYRLQPPELLVDSVALTPCAIRAVTSDLVDLEIGSLRVRARVAVYGEEIYVNSSTGQSYWREVSPFTARRDQVAPGSLTSPVPGTVVRILCEAGSKIEQGAGVMIIEAMKMQHEIVAPTAGTVDQVLVTEGSHVDAGAAVAVLANSEQGAAG